MTVWHAVTANGHALTLPVRLAAIGCRPSVLRWVPGIGVFATIRFLVTGATGFIGRRLVNLLVERHGAESVACLVTPGSATNGVIAEGVCCVTGDLTCASVAATRPPCAEVVFHLAANIDTNATDAECRVNDEGTANLIAWLGDSLRGRRIMFASSVAVYDRAPTMDAPLDEQSVLSPRTAYGRTKQRAEGILADAANGVPFTFTTLRLPTVYGPGQKPGGLFDRLAQCAESRAWIGRLNWPGRTSIVQVDDVAALLIDLAEMPEAANETFCVASEENLTVGDIARRLGSLTGHPVAPIDLPPVVWRTLRWIAWSPVVTAVIPRRARLSHWRLGVLTANAFWQSAAKLREIYPRRLTTL
jgi:nucleoside-diphosphate-sugar epimerase